MMNCIFITCPVYHPEDAIVNGKPDNVDDRRMPHLYMKGDGDCFWEALIDIRTGKIQNWYPGFTAETDYKVCDQLTWQFGDLSHRGYVPAFLSAHGDGDDYVSIKIDAEGRIENWRSELVYKMLDKAALSFRKAVDKLLNKNKENDSPVIFHSSFLIFHFFTDLRVTARPRGGFVFFRNSSKITERMPYHGECYAEEKAGCGKSARCAYAELRRYRLVG